MLRSFGLRPKLLMIMVGGAVLLAATLSEITAFALLSARNRALVEAANGLKQQGAKNLDFLVARTAALTSERLVDASDAGAAAEQALLVQESQQLIDPGYTDRVELTMLPGGALHDQQRGQATTLYAPPQAQATVETTLRDLQTSAILDAIFPKQRLSSRNIIAMAYVGPSGLIRLYPPEDPTRRDFSRELALLEHYRQGAKGEMWLKPFRNLDIIGYGGVVTAVVRPIYSDERFNGIIITYVSLSSISIDLDGLAPTDNAFAFLIDSNKTLIAAPSRAMPYLLKIPSQPLLEPRTIEKTGAAELDQALDNMALGISRRGGDQVLRINIDGRDFFLVYEPISISNWSLGIMVPLDELTAQAGEVSNAIRETSNRMLRYSRISAAFFVLLTLLVSLYLSRRLTRPLHDLAQAAGAIAAGDYNQQVDSGHGDELGRVATAFNTMSQSVLRSREQMQAQNRLLEKMVQARTADLQATVGQLEESLERQKSLYDLLREVSTPVIPVAREVLLMPLIGALDEQRANHAIRMLLDNVEDQRCKVVILDVTGLPVINTGVAAVLLRAARAARLLGAETIVAGIRPEVAETLISLELGLEELHPAANLQLALSEALRRIERSQQRNGAKTQG